MFVDLYRALDRIQERQTRRREDSATENLTGPAAFAASRDVRAARGAREAALAAMLFADDDADAREKFEQNLVSMIATESDAIRMLEEGHDAITEYGEDLLTERYDSLVRSFFRTFGLPYDLTAAARVMPSVPGLFWGMYDALERSALADDARFKLLREFKDTLHDLRFGRTEKRLKNCIASQLSFLESITRSHPEVQSNTFSAMCAEVAVWPSGLVKGSVVQLAKFANSYVGIRHAGEPGAWTRDLDTRDFVAATFLLSGFSPYLWRESDSEALFAGWTP